LIFLLLALFLQLDIQQFVNFFLKIIWLANSAFFSPLICIKYVDDLLLIIPKEEVENTLTILNGLPKWTVFIQKGGQIFFSGHNYTFWGQIVVFHDSKNFKTIFWVKFWQVKI
jgi:hypothetical protein